MNDKRQSSGKWFKLPSLKTSSSGLLGCETVELLTNTHSPRQTPQTPRLQTLSKSSTTPRYANPFLTPPSSVVGPFSDSFSEPTRPPPVKPFAYSGSPRSRRHLIGKKCVFCDEPLESVLHQSAFVDQDEKVIELQCGDQCHEHCFTIISECESMACTACGRKAVPIDVELVKKTTAKSLLKRPEVSKKSKPDLSIDVVRRSLDRKKPSRGSSVSAVSSIISSASFLSPTESSHVSDQFVRELVSRKVYVDKDLVDSNYITRLGKLRLYDTLSVSLDNEKWELGTACYLFASAVLLVNAETCIFPLYAKTIKSPVTVAAPSVIKLGRENCLYISSQSSEVVEKWGAALSDLNLEIPSAIISTTVSLGPSDPVEIGKIPKPDKMTLVVNCAKQEGLKVCENVVKALELIDVAVTMWQSNLNLHPSSVVAGSGKTLLDIASQSVTLVVSATPLNNLSLPNSLLIHVGGQTTDKVVGVLGWNHVMEAVYNLIDIDFDSSSEEEEEQVDDCRVMFQNTKLLNKRFTTTSIESDSDEEIIEQALNNRWSRLFSDIENAIQETKTLTEPVYLDEKPVDP